MATAEIERILSCDESARAAVEKARGDAETLSASASEEIENFRKNAQKEIERFKEEEISAIINQAEAKALEVEKNASSYCAKIEGLAESHKEELISTFLTLFYREAGIKDQAVNQ